MLKYYFVQRFPNIRQNLRWNGCEKKDRLNRECLRAVCHKEIRHKLVHTINN